jgi:hypothetical protein
MESSSDPIEKAFRRLRAPFAFPLGDRNLVVACLVREADWRPLEAPWWKGKEACVIGADTDGNFFLRHCDGSVRYWQHKAQADIVVARSVREFLGKLADDHRP